MIFSTFNGASYYTRYEREAGREARKSLKAAVGFWIFHLLSAFRAAVVVVGRVLWLGVCVCVCVCVSE